MQFIEKNHSFHFKLGSILTMMTAVVNDGVRSVDGMQEQPGFDWSGFPPLLEGSWSRLSLTHFSQHLRLAPFIFPLLCSSLEIPLAATGALNWRMG